MIREAKSLFVASYNKSWKYRNLLAYLVLVAVLAYNFNGIQSSREQHIKDTASTSYQLCKQIENLKKGNREKDLQSEKTSVANENIGLALYSKIQYFQAHPSELAVIKKASEKALVAQNKVIVKDLKRNAPKNCAMLPNANDTTG